MLGVLEYLLRYAQRVVELPQDVDDYEFEGPISRDKENDPMEMLIMGYKKYINAGEDADDALLGYIFYYMYSFLNWCQIGGVLANQNASWNYQFLNQFS